MRKALSLLFLLVTSALFAQTTYTQEGDAFASRNPSEFSVEGVQFDNGLYLGWAEAAQHHACYGVPLPTDKDGNPIYDGWMFYTLNGADSPCLPVKDYFLGPPSGQAKCNFNASIHIDFVGGLNPKNGIYFQGGTYDATFLWFYSGYGRTSGCYRKITSATITLQ